MYTRTLGKLCLQVLIIYNNFRKADHTSNETDNCQSEILIGMIKLILSDICTSKERTCEEHIYACRQMWCFLP